jgi:hypothetical protein
MNGFVVNVWPSADALQLYLAQDKRSLKRVAEECAKHSIKASLPTLKRWSARFCWRSRVTEHDQAAAQESQARSIDYRVQLLTDRLRLIDIAKSRFEWLLNPENPALTPAQRRRATNATLSDYLRILKMELDAFSLLHVLEASESRQATWGRSRRIHSEKARPPPAFPRRPEGTPR